LKGEAVLKRLPALIVVAVAGGVAAFTGVAGSSATTSGAARYSDASTQLRIVALGDSDTAGNGDPTGVGWVGRYAKLLRKKLGVRITVANLAQDGKTSRSSSLTSEAMAPHAAR
jgi:lysophospholipase L1-like esterase